MTTLEIIELSVLLAICIIALVVFFIKAIKNKWFKQITDTINTSIAEAEKLYSEANSGSKKKEYVINAVKNKCNELGIPYNILKLLISKTIDTIVKDFNIVNGK